MEKYKRKKKGKFTNLKHAHTHTHTYKNFFKYLMLFTVEKKETEHTNCDY